MGKVLLIGWDGADWEMINPLLDGGELPHLSKMVQSGVIGNLATLSPCLSPILWTSIATGRTADQHGILGFIEPTEDGLGVRPASSVSRRCKALWNIASQRDLKSVVVGWYATQPAEPINGVCVSDVAVQLDWGSVGQRLPMAEEGVWPPRVSEMADWLRIHPFEIEASDLLGLIPSVAEIDLKLDPKPLRLAEVLARDYTVHAVATALLETEPWDFAAVYYPGLDTAGHFFMPYHPPQMAHIEDRDYTLYKDVMCGLYRAYDQMLGRMMEIAGPDVHIVVVSDHGFHSGNRRPLISSHGATPHAEAAQWHRGWGIVAMQGPMIVADDRVHGATLLDIAPTILALLGLPGDKTMPGKILTQAFRVPDFLEPLSDWESEPGACGMHAEDKRSDTLAAASAILQLQNLGYLSELPNGSHPEETVIGRFKTSHSWALQNQQRCECSVSALKLASRTRRRNTINGSCNSSGGQNPSSGLAATFSPDDRGEGTGMPIRLAGDARRFRRLDILVRRTTVVFSDLTAQPTKPRIEMCTAENSKKKHSQWQLPFFRGQNPSSGLAATFSPDDRGEGTGRKRFSKSRAASGDAPDS